MRESLMYGSVRGARGNSRPYRDNDRHFICCICSRQLMAHWVDSLRCEGSDAIGAKRTCRERRERVDLTKMTHLGSGVCIAAVEDDCVTSYSITASARARSVGGSVSPSAWAVLTLMTSSNFVGCSTGRSPALAPLRILSR
jgi:hypothetical protein